MATAPARIEINPFPAGKRCAFTTSWDDGRVYDRRIVAAFNEWGIKGTFNLNSGSLTRTGKPAPADSTGHLDASEVASLFAGHEVAIHTVTHPHLHKLDASQIATEVLDDRRALEDLVGYPVRGMAYPFGTYSSRVIDVLRGLGIVYSRTVENDASGTFPPREPLAWAPTMHKLNDAPPLPERFEKAWNGAASMASFMSGATATSLPIATTGARWNGCSNRSLKNRTSGIAPILSSSITKPPAAASPSPPTGAASTIPAHFRSR
jgi:peptidoglycan/xylan/chitin deacetylase (PgdA/CDA1 family)